ncbi:helix-turn-helix domain-containing protein [Streptomyces sp. NPDC053726]|uniref:helix-turn-helix domain-containing protein n=1 Tax=Streptomyces sp. NPDC053726 TaxID=3365713 RepID=UPI0037D6F6BD
MANLDVTPSRPPGVRHHVPVTRTTLDTWDVGRFKEACHERGLTLQQVSVRSGIPYSAVRSYSWGGANPTPARLAQLAQALGVSTIQLAPLSTEPTLNELRWHAGLTVAELARRIGYSVSHTSSVLHGVVPMTDPPRWAKALHQSRAAVEKAWDAAKETQARDDTP